MISASYILEIIKETLADNLATMKMNGTNSDYLDGANTALKTLAMDLQLCEYSDLRD